MLAHWYMEEHLLAPKTSWINLTPAQQREIDQHSIKSGWKILPRETLPSFFSSDFREKLDSAMMIAAPTSTGGTYLVYNALRVDIKDSAIDQEPFSIIVHSSGPSPSGMFIHHGNWEGRTYNPPKVFWDQVRESGVGNYFFSHPPLGITSGTHDQLPEGHREAFEQSINRIRTSTT